MVTNYTKQDIESSGQIVRNFLARFLPDYDYEPLLLYAALPLVLTPELLHYLRHRFVPHIPWVAEIDILLSEELCRERGYEQYIMNTPIRIYLLQRAKQRQDIYIEDAAKLMVQYLHAFARTQPYATLSDMQAQQWSALAFIKNERSTVAQEITTAIETASNQQPGGIPSNPELKRLAALAEQLAPELEGHPEIIEYAQYIRRILRGDTSAVAARKVPTTAATHRIFISYTRNDLAFAQRIAHDLRSQGHYIWIDIESIPSRSLSFVEEIRDAINAADRFVLIAGKDTNDTDYLRAEWQHALRTDNGISILLRLGEYADLPKELANLHVLDFRHDEDYKLRLAELTQQLAEPVAPIGSLFNVPTLIRDFVGRENELGALRESAIKGLQTRITVIEGMAGIGKSALAGAFAYDREVRFAFPDGIIWLTVGQTSSLHELCRTIGSSFEDNISRYDDESLAQQSAQQILADKRCLLILDDVWEESVVTAFIRLASGTAVRLLITTRDASILQRLNVSVLRLDIFNEDETIQLLTADLPIDKDEIKGNLPILKELAQRADYLPLTLSLIKHQLSERLLQSISLAEAVQYVLEQLSEVLNEIVDKQQTSKTATTQVPRTLKLFICYRSSDAAKVDKIARDLALLRYDDGTPRYIPWQDKRSLPPASPNWWDAIVDAIIDCEIFVFFLSEASLQSDNCLAELDYAHQHNRPVIPVVLNGEFFLNPQSGKYNLSKEMWTLLPDWLAERQFLFDAGAEFYSRFQQAITLYERNWPRDIAAPRPPDPNQRQSNRLLYTEACDLASRLAFTDAEKRFNMLVRRNDPDYADVAVQWLELIRTYAELVEIDERQDLVSIFSKKWASYTDLFPNEFLENIFDPKGFAARTASPRGGLFAILRENDIEIKSSQGQTLAKLTGHTKRVNDIAWSPDGRTLASASDDRTVRIWDTATWQTLHTLLGHRAPVTGVLELSDGRLLSWSDDRTLRLWSLNGKVLAVLRGHNDSIVSVYDLKDGRIKSSDANGVELIWSSNGQIEKRFDSSAEIIETTQILESLIYKVLQLHKDPETDIRSLNRLWRRLQNIDVEIPSGYTEALNRFSELRNRVGHSDPKNAITSSEVGQALDSIRPIIEWLTNLTLRHGESSSAEALRALAVALAQAGEGERAATVFTQAETVAATIADDNSRAEALRALAAALAQAGDYDRAETVAATIADDNSRAEALRALAVALAQAGEGERAATVFTQAETVAATIADDNSRAEALRSLAYDFNIEFDTLESGLRELVVSTNAHSANIYIIDTYRTIEATYSFPADVSVPSLRLQENDISMQVIRDRKPIIINDLYREVERINPQLVQSPVKSALYFPFREEQDNAIGVLLLQFTTSREFDDIELSKISKVVTRLEVIYENNQKNQLKQVENHLDRILARMKNISNIQEILRLTGEAIFSILQCDALTLYQYDPDQQKLIHPPIMNGVIDPASAARLGYMQPDSLVYTLLNKDSHYYVEDVQTDPLFKDKSFAQREAIRSVVAILLRDKQSVVGIAFANYRTHHLFTSHETEIVDLISSRVAEAVLEATRRIKVNPSKHISDITRFMDWVESLRETVSGRITISNMLYDFFNSRLPKTLWASLVEDILEIWNNNDVSESPGEILSRLTRLRPDRYLLQGPPVAKRQCSRVMDARELFRNNLDYTVTGFELLGDPTVEQIKDLETLGLKNVAYGMMQGRSTSGVHSIVRVADTDELRGLLAKSDNQQQQANLVRNTLGLIHFSGDNHLVEIKYPYSVLQTLNLKSPTFLDIGGGIARSFSSNDYWGASIDLATLGIGIREAVHQPVEFTGEFTLRYIGQLNSSPPAIDYQKLEQTFSYQPTNESIEEFRTALAKQIG